MSLSLTVDALLHPFSYPNGQIYNVAVEFMWVAAHSAADERKKEPLRCLGHVVSITTAYPSTADGPPLDTDGRRFPELTAKLPLERLKLVSEGNVAEFSDDDCPSTSCISSTASDQQQWEAQPSFFHEDKYLTCDGHDDGSTKLGSNSRERSTERGMPPIVYKTSLGPRFGNELFEVAESKVAGWGAFATQSLRRGEIILREKPLFVADHSCLFQEYDKLDGPAKEVALSLYANELFKSGLPRIQRVFETNCFSVGGRLAGLFPIAARFNHSCHPTQNVGFEYDEASQCLVLYVRADEIPAGEELKISYGKDRTLAELYMTYGFRCRCGGCPGMSDRELKMLTSRW